MREAADDGLQRTGIDADGDYWECDYDEADPTADGGCILYTELNFGYPAYLCSLWISTT